MYLFVLSLQALQTDILALTERFFASEGSLLQHCPALSLLLLIIFFLLDHSKDPQSLLLPVGARTNGWVDWAVLSNEREEIEIKAETGTIVTKGYPQVTHNSFDSKLPAGAQSSR